MTTLKRIHQKSAEIGSYENDLFCVSIKIDNAFDPIVFVLNSFTNLLFVEWS